MTKRATLQHENKPNLLGQARKKAGVSKAAVYEELFIDHRKLRAYETGNEPPAVIGFVLDAAELYGDPTLPERYFAQWLGRKIEPRDLPGAVLGILAEYDDVREIRSRLIEIAEDGTIDEKERADFDRVMAELLELEQRIESLRYWAAEHLYRGERGKAA